MLPQANLSFIEAIEATVRFERASRNATDCSPCTYTQGAFQSGHRAYNPFHFGTDDDLCYN